MGASPAIAGALRTGRVSRARYPRSNGRRGMGRGMETARSLLSAPSIWRKVRASVLRLVPAFQSRPLVVAFFSLLVRSVVAVDRRPARARRLAQPRPIRIGAGGRLAVV